jgi:hypothetical protein
VTSVACPRGTPRGEEAVSVGGAADAKEGRMRSGMTKPARRVRITGDLQAARLKSIGQDRQSIDCRCQLDWGGPAT